MLWDSKGTCELSSIIAEVGAHLRHFLQFRLFFGILWLAAIPFEILITWLRFVHGCLCSLFVTEELRIVWGVTQICFCYRAIAHMVAPLLDNNWAQLVFGVSVEEWPASHLWLETWIIYVKRWKNYVGQGRFGEFSLVGKASQCTGWNPDGDIRLNGTICK